MRKFVQGDHFSVAIYKEGTAEPLQGLGKKRVLAGYAWAFMHRVCATTCTTTADISLLGPSVRNGLMHCSFLLDHYRPNQPVEKAVV